MTPLYAILATLTVVALAAAELLRREAVKNEKALLKAESELRHARADIHGAILPLVWMLDLQEDQPRIGTYATTALVSVRDALGATDVEMADLVDHARLVGPPRRLPKYPQTPPFLATPEDVVR